MRIRNIWCAVFFLAVSLDEALGDGPTCGEPPIFELASITSLISSENPVGTVVTYACQFGYVIDGPSRTSTCKLTEDGDKVEWSEPRATCIPRSCGDPGFVSNGHRVGSLFTFPNSVSYECDEGFRLQGSNSKRYCQASGSWSGRLPRCEAVTCDPPKNPENGRVTYTSLEFGSELKFICDNGFGLQDTTPVYCTSDGTWSKTDVTCVESACEILQKPDHGSVNFIGAEGNPRAGTIAIFSCEGDRIPSGPTSSKCLSIGQWTFPAPDCLEPCRIPFVKNGRIGKWVSQTLGRGQKYQEIRVGEKVEDDDKLFLHCDHGYRPLGSTTNWQAMLKCKGGKWSDVPYCELATCSSEPPEAENGRVDKMENTHGGTVLYECLQGFKKVKTGNVNCDMGEWKGVPPICKDARCYSAGVKYLTGVAEIAKVTQDGDEVKIRCHEGYEPMPYLPQCSVGEWIRNQESPCKEKDCTVPYILNGYMEELILGPEKFNWWKVRWERKITKKTVQIGSVPSRSATLFIICHNRFSVQGKGLSAASIMCSQGRWSPDPVCLITGSIYRPSSTVQSITANANSFTDWKSTTATVLSHSKSSGSNLQTQPLGTTAKSVPAVSPETSEVPVESDDEESYSPTDSEEYEDTCSCEYLPDENIIAYVDDKEVKLHERVKNGTILKLRCEKIGYHRLLGPREIECENCKPWSSSDFPSCLKPERGDTIILFENVNVSLDGVLEVQKGQSLKLICTAMETAKFPKWRFPNVTGINTSEELRERTGDVLYLSHLDIKNVTSEHNGPYECSVDDEVPTKLEVQIVDPNARCPKISIEEEEKLVVEYDGADMRVGSTATFSCLLKGQKLNGTKVATCLRTEEWSLPPPHCTDITCKQLKGSDLMTISYTDNQKIGSFANFHCFAPGIRSGVARTQCLENGEWKDSLPTCQTPPCSFAYLSLAIPRIVKIESDYANDSILPYNTTVKLACYNGKTLVGKPFAKCGGDGKWEVDDIQCISGCLPLQKEPGSKLIIQPEKVSYKFGDSVTFLCQKELDLNIDVEKAMCLPGGWSVEALPECVKSDNNGSEEDF